MSYIGTELYSNNNDTTLSGAISNVATTLSVASGSGALFPSPTAGTSFFRITLTDAATKSVHEVMYVTGRVGDVFTVLRAQEGTTAVSWVAGDAVYCGPTAGAMANLVQAGQLQTGAYQYAADTGTANTYVVNLLLNGLYSPVPGSEVRFTPAHANTGASTLSVNAGVAYPLLGANRQPLAGGELIVGGCAYATWDNALTSWVLMSCTGGAQPVASGSAAAHAVSVGQLQAQTNLSFTSAGTAPNYTLTPTAPLLSYAANQRFNVKFNANGTVGSNTLNVSGLGAKNLKYYTSSGAKSPAYIYSGMVSDVVYDGTDWVVLSPIVSGAVSSVNVVVFTSSGTYTPSANLKFADVQVQAGGGGGGCGSLGTVGAGGAGAYTRGIFTAATIGSSIAVTVGTGGAGGASGGGSGGNGNPSQFGSLLMCNGGVGGGTALNSSGLGGTVATAGYVAIPGQPGHTGSYQWANNGASSLFGAGGLASGNGLAGGAALGYGAGGAGTYGTGGGGGAGAAGIVIIIEYLV